jgi:hypothetical protein
VLAVWVAALTSDCLSNLHASARHCNKFGRTKAIRRQIKSNSCGYDNSHNHINQLYINRITFAHGRLFCGNTRLMRAAAGPALPSTIAWTRTEHGGWDVRSHAARPR